MCTSSRGTCHRQVRHVIRRGYFPAAEHAPVHAQECDRDQESDRMVAALKRLFLCEGQDVSRCFEYREENPLARQL
jgi:hypothetical protein